MANQEVLTPIPTEQQSIDSIIASEAALLGCMADLFCGTPEGTPGIVNFLTNAPSTTIEDKKKRSELVKQILCSYGCKECAIAEVIEAIADKTVVDNDIIENDQGCSCCKCK